MVRAQAVVPRDGVLWPMVFCGAGAAAAGGGGGPGAECQVAKTTLVP